MEKGREKVTKVEEEREEEWEGERKWAGMESPHNGNHNSTATTPTFSCCIFLYGSHCFWWFWIIILTLFLFFLSLPELILSGWSWIFDVIEFNGGAIQNVDMFRVFGLDFVTPSTFSISLSLSLLYPIQNIRCIPLHRETDAPGTLSQMARAALQFDHGHCRKQESTRPGSPMRHLGRTDLRVVYSRIRWPGERSHPCEDDIPWPRAAQDVLNLVLFTTQIIIQIMGLVSTSVPSA